MLNEKSELVEYLRLIGEDDDFKKEYNRRINIDENKKLVLKKTVRMLKIKKIFNI